MGKAAPYTFLAVWPVEDNSLPRGELLQEALGDLRAVADRHGAVIAGTPQLRFGRGQEFAGMHAHPLVVVAIAPALKRPAGGGLGGNVLDRAA